MTFANNSFQSGHIRISVELQQLALFCCTVCIPCSVETLRFSWNNITFRSQCIAVSAGHAPPHLVHFQMLSGLNRERRVDTEFAYFSTSVSNCSTYKAGTSAEMRYFRPENSAEFGSEASQGIPTARIESALLQLLVNCRVLADWWCQMHCRWKGNHQNHQNLMEPVFLKEIWIW